MPVATSQLRILAARYAPAWLLATAATAACVAIAQTVNHSAVVVALVGTGVETIVYYGILLWCDVRTDRSRQPRYGVRGLGRTLLNLTVESGVAEAIDTLFTRPLLLVAATQLVCNLTLGVVLANAAADICFFVPAIAVHEMRRCGWGVKPRLGMVELT